MSPPLRNPYVWAFVVGCAVVTLMRPLLRRVPAPPTEIGRVPGFTLVTSRGEPFGSETLAGHVYVANLFSTRCSLACQERMRSMARLASHYREEKRDSIRLVSLSVDPAHDTPERLREAEGLYAVDPQRWVLLTGPIEQIRALAERGLGAVAAEDLRAAADATEGPQFFLVDGRGGLRGRYESTALGLDEVYWRARRVAEEEEGRRGG